LDIPPTDSHGCLTAINWLRDQGEITPVEHFLFSEGIVRHNFPPN
jgi:hypothetical protein